MKGYCIRTTFLQLLTTLMSKLSTELGDDTAFEFYTTSLKPAALVALSTHNIHRDGHILTSIKISSFVATNSSKIRHVYTTKASRTMTARHGKLIIYVMGNVCRNGLPPSSADRLKAITACRLALY